jgi:hypothetical protein
MPASDGICIERQRDAQSLTRGSDRNLCVGVRSSLNGSEDRVLGVAYRPGRVVDSHGGVGFRILRVDIRDIRIERGSALSM